MLSFLKAFGIKLPLDKANAERIKDIRKGQHILLVFGKTIFAQVGVQFAKILTALLPKFELVKVEEGKHETLVLIKAVQNPIPWIAVILALAAGSAVLGFAGLVLKEARLFFASPGVIAAAFGAGALFLTRGVHRAKA